MEEQEEITTKVIKITMPSSYANFFVEDCRLNYSDSRWLKIKFMEKVCNALLDKEGNEVIKEFNNVREELAKNIREMYDAEMRRLRSIVKNFER